MERRVSKNHLSFAKNTSAESILLGCSSWGDVHRALTRNSWIDAQLRAHFSSASQSVLDVGCGAGFLSNYLSERGHAVTGLDASIESLDVARHHDATQKVRYECGDAYRLPFADESFEAVCIMDFLEHVEEPARAVAEASRVLRQGGLFFFSTFNRNWLSWLIVIKGVERVVANTPPNMHILRLFVKPSEAGAMCRDNGLRVKAVHGFIPDLYRGAFWRMLFTRRVEDDFRFRFVKSTATGYIGVAEKG